MADIRYTLGSPEVLRFLNLSERDVAPEYRGEQIKRFVDRLSTDDNVAYESALVKQGANPQALKFLDDYIEFDPEWKTKNAVDQINALTQIAHDKPNPVYAYGLKEGPLYRGTKLDASPGVGETVKLERFKSFSPDINIAGPFVNEGPPLDFTMNDEAFKQREEIERRKQKVLFQVQADSPGSFHYLITPGAGEPEVLARPGSEYLVEAKQTFPFHQRGMTGDIDFIKLRQLYGIDPVGAGIKGAADVLKRNASGVAIGVAASALDPSIAQQIEKKQYTDAAKNIASDFVLGATAEEGIKRLAPLAGRHAPSLVKIGAKASLLAPIAIGAALFSQGKPGSITDVITRKAAQKPVSWLPSVKPNPRTDLGSRASRAIGNEARYVWQKVLSGKLPYFHNP